MKPILLIALLLSGGAVVGCKDKPYICDEFDITNDDFTGGGHGHELLWFSGKNVGDCFHYYGRTYIVLTRECPMDSLTFYENKIYHTNIPVGFMEKLESITPHRHL